MKQAELYSPYDMIYCHFIFFQIDPVEFISIMFLHPSAKWHAVILRITISPQLETATLSYQSLCSSVILTAFIKGNLFQISDATEYN